MVVDLLGEDPDDDMAGPLVRHVRDHVRYVVVDEYQDTNPVQEKLIERLCRFGANLCVVGDDDQTIYQWRGSAVSNILTFVERQDGVRTVTLDDNFRSSQGDRRARPGRRRAERPRAAAEEHGRRRPPAVRPRRHARARPSTRPRMRRRWICDRIGRLRGMPFLDAAGRGAARAVVVGFRGAVPQRQQGRRAHWSRS